ncbi:MAG: ATP-binding cassette domain-containing protein [Gammaproteobacteria bacterium]|jgi:phospholipid/cholesterol/gamma-HCH transport system ATP-binding protein
MAALAISVKGLVNQFADKRVHDGLDMEVRQGEIFSIVGGSGSGKSVLLRSMLGLQQPRAGEIVVLGMPIEPGRPVPHSAWGVLFQHGALFSGLTVRENVELPIALHSRMDDKVRAKLASLKIQMVGLPPEAENKVPSELSGGMVKRAALARALALDPQLLFLDEPTAGLDPIAAEEFEDVVLYLRESLDLTVVIITHDLDTLYSLSDRVAVLVDGKARTGTLDEVAEIDHPWISSYFNGVRARIIRSSESVV